MAKCPHCRKEISSSALSKSKKVIICDKCGGKCILSRSSYIVLFVLFFLFGVLYPRLYSILSPLGVWIGEEAYFWVFATSYLSLFAYFFQRFFTVLKPVEGDKPAKDGLLRPDLLR